MHSATRKDWRAQSNQIHGRWRPNQLSWRSSDTNSRNVSGKDTVQQCHINKRSKIHDNRHLQFLPQHTTETTRIIARASTQQTRLLSKQAHPRTLETQNSTNTIHTRGGWLRSQISRQRACRTSHRSTTGTLQNQSRLDRQQIRRHAPPLGLRQTPSTSTYARLRQEGPDLIRTQTTKETKPTIPPHTNTIWSKETICQKRIHLPQTRQSRQEIHTTGLR